MLASARLIKKIINKRFSIKANTREEKEKHVTSKKNVVLFTFRPHDQLISPAR